MECQPDERDGWLDAQGVGQESLGGIRGKKDVGEPGQQCQRSAGNPEDQPVKKGDVDGGDQKADEVGAPQSKCLPADPGEQVDEAVR